MTAMGESDSSLAAKCLDLCQTLAGQGLVFNFSLKVGSSFSFSLDARDKGLASDTPGKIKKKPSPSMLRRNARRKEAFLKKKLNPAPVPLERDVEPEVGLPKQGEDIFKCAICGNSFKSDIGVKIHKRKTHKSQELPQLEIIRSPDIVKSKHVSPLKDVREELPNLQVLYCDVCGEKFETQHSLFTHMNAIEWCPRCQVLSCNIFNPSSTICPGCSTPWASPFNESKV